MAKQYRIAVLYHVFKQCIRYSRVFMSNEEREPEYLVLYA